MAKAWYVLLCSEYADEDCEQGLKRKYTRFVRKSEDRERKEGE
jgi:NTP pyrophosphatase (non-canonical NTP hydrolase)